MREDAAALARRLARNAEAVCRHYLSKGRREGTYWRVGDLANTPGRSLFVSLIAPNPGKWSDAAISAARSGGSSQQAGLSNGCQMRQRGPLAARSGETIT